MEPENVTHFDSPSAFRRWLEDYHQVREVLWVGYWKKSTGRPSLTWEESVDEAICFGWIDGLRHSVDEDSYTIRFTPRRPGSRWSDRNIRRYEAMESRGRIKPAGKKAFEAGMVTRRAQGPGKGADDLALSEEYLGRLKANQEAWKDWQARPEGYRKQVARWVMSAARESTRRRRLDTLIQDCAAGRKIKPLRF